MDPRTNVTTAVLTTTPLPGAQNKIVAKSWLTVTFCVLVYILMMAYVIGPLKPFCRCLWSRVKQRRMRSGTNPPAEAGGSPRHRREELHVAENEGLIPEAAMGDLNIAGFGRDERVLRGSDGDAAEGGTSDDILKGDDGDDHVVVLFSRNRDTGEVLVDALGDPVPPSLRDPNFLAESPERLRGGSVDDRFGFWSPQMMENRSLTPSPQHNDESPTVRPRASASVSNLNLGGTSATSRRQPSRQTIPRTDGGDPDAITALDDDDPQDTCVPLRRCYGSTNLKIQD